MLPLHRSRRKARRFLFYSLIVLGFLLIWCTLTIAILFLQDTIFGSTPSSTDNSYVGRGLQVVVGHYNGNQIQEKSRNFTDDELNANNYSPLPGWGEGGRPVRLSKEEEVLADESFMINQFNLYVSDRISINRSIPDIRKQSCREKKYPDPSSLPKTSIIIVYHNEAYSSLLRTVTSIISRSPREVLQEIILVDDFSTRTFLKYPKLDESLKNLPVTVKIIRANERVGLIRARMMGAQEATGDVLTFLDSHCECTTGWLEPLLTRIKENRKNVVCPVIDVINDHTFQYQKGIELFRGGFNWNMQFRWYSMPSKIAKFKLRNPTSPIESPTMAGGLFSIDRKYFEELGAYDPGMDIWGGENLEISFRIWQCGGRVEILPCSHVGHIFRKASPHDFPGKSSGKVLNTNLLRVAEVWMDDWKYLFYKVAPQAQHLRHEVDVSERIEIRKRLACKDFRWYLDNVFTDHFLPTEKDFFGRIFSSSLYSLNNTCLTWTVRTDTRLKMSSLADCNEDFDRSQLWLYTGSGRIRSDEHLCLSATQVVHTSNQWMVQLKECAEYEHEYWDYNNHKKLFKHRKSGLCLSRPFEIVKDRDVSKVPVLTKCGKAISEQMWLLKSIEWLPKSDSDDFSS